MCWGDMKHYRDAYGVTQELANAGTVTLPANANRIRVAFAGSFSSLAVAARVFLNASSTGPIITLTNGNPTYVMTIEEWGNMVQGTLMIVNNGGATMTITEIISREHLDHS